MSTDVIPYEPYHPHLGYTLAIAALAWVSVTLYSRYLLSGNPRLRVALYSLTIGLPLYAELATYLIYIARPAPDTWLGYILTHIHEKFIHDLPIDSFLSASTSEFLIAMLAGLALISLVRFLVGTRQLNRAVANALPLPHSEHTHVLAQLMAIAKCDNRRLPPILLYDSPLPLAFTTGILQPRIYVSNTLLKLLTDEEVVTVLCHEWAHVLRRDTVWSWLLRLLRDMLWFLPSSHLAWRFMLASQDEDCDVLAATMTRQPLTLARALVKVAGANMHAKPPALIGANSFALAGRTPRARVEQMLRLHTQAERPSRAVVFGAKLLGLTLLLLAILPGLLGS